jgi:hypothetical protein
MSFPTAWMGDQKEGYKCAVCGMPSEPAKGGRYGHETLHANYCRAVG